MRYLPIELEVRGREALVIGVSAEVVSKIDRLVEAGAHVTVIAEGDPGSEVEERAREGIVTLHRRAFTDADRAGKLIVFVAPFTTPAGEAEAQRLHAWAQQENRLLCTVDRPEACTFINAAIVEVSGLKLTISTGGASPGAGAPAARGSGRGPGRSARRDVRGEAAVAARGAAPGRARGPDGRGREGLQPLGHAAISSLVRSR